MVGVGAEEVCGWVVWASWREGCKDWDDGGKSASALAGSGGRGGPVNQGTCSHCCVSACAGLLGHEAMPAGPANSARYAFFAL